MGCKSRGDGGNGGGGNGESLGDSSIKTSDMDGLPHTGGGGGGSRYSNAGNGGSGIIIIKYKRKQILNPMTYNYLTVETSDADNLILMKLSGFIERGPYSTTSFPWTTDQQNDQFLALLVAKPPAGINIFSHYDPDTSKVPDARGLAYDVDVIGTAPVPETESAGEFNATNSVTSMYGTADTTWTFPSSADQFTTCWLARHDTVDNSDWHIICSTSASGGVYVRDQQYDAAVTPMINTGTANWVHSRYHWNQELSQDDILIVTTALRKEIGGIPYKETHTVVPISDLRAYHLRFLLALRPPLSINIFADITGTAIGSTVRNRVTGLPHVEVTAGTATSVRTTTSLNGADNDITALAGTSTTKLLWPLNSAPATMTICSISRLVGTGGTVLTTATSSQWTANKDLLHGFYGGNRGVSYAGNQYRTENINKGVKNDWLVFCENSGADQPDNCLIDNLSIGTNNQILTQSGRFSINYYQPGDFQIHSLYVWNAVLSPAQMRVVASALRAQIGGQPDIANNLLGPAVIPMVPSPTAYEQVYIPISPQNVLNYSPFIKINKPIDNAWHHYTLYAKSATEFGINIDNHTIAEKTLDYQWIVNLNQHNVDLNMSIGRGAQSGEITQSYMSDFRIYNKYDENVIKRLAYVPQYPELRIGASQEYQLYPNVSKSFDNTLIAWYRFDNAPYDLSTLPNYGAFNNIDLTIQNKDKIIVHDTTSPSSGYAYYMETSNMNHYLELSNVEECINTTRTIMFWMKNTDSEETIVKNIIEIPTYMNITIDSKINYNVSNITISTAKQLDNNWHHYAFIHNLSGYLDILIDGLSMNSNVTNVDFITAIADTQMIIGKGISGIYLSDLRFYNDYDIQMIQYMSKNKPYESASIASYIIGTNVSKDIRPGNLQNFNVWWGSTETIVEIINIEAITKTFAGSLRNAFAYHFNNTCNYFGAYLKLEQGELLEKTLYNRFEISISYWKNMASHPISTSNEIVIDDILTISSFQSNVQLEMSNPNTITTSSNIIALDTWYLYNYVIGYNKKHMSMSISVYNTTLEQVDSQSIIVPSTYDISRFKNYSGEIKLLGHSDYKISNFKIYNKLLTNADIVGQSANQTNVIFDLDVNSVSNAIIVEPYNTYNVISSNVGGLYPDYSNVDNNSILLGNNNYISIHSNIIHSLYNIEFAFTYWKKNNIANYNTDFSMYHSNIDGGFENHLTLSANIQDFTIYNLDDSFSNENLISHNTDWHMYTYNMKYKNGITSNSISYDSTYITKTKIGFVPFKGFTNTINDIYIGSHEQDTNHIVNFLIEDIKVYNTYLTESKVNTMYFNTILPIYTKTENLSGLQLWYRLQEYTINGVMSSTITNSANNTGLYNGSYAGTNVSKDNDSSHETRNRYSSHSANDLVGHWTTLESGNPIDTNGFSLSNYTDFTIMYKQKILSEVYSKDYTIITDGQNFNINTPDVNGDIKINIGEYVLTTNAPISVNIWVSWAFTMTMINSSNMVEIYKDGLLLAYESVSSLNIDNTFLKIADVENVDMLLDDIRIYNRALTNNEINKYAKGNA